MCCKLLDRTTRDRHQTELDCNKVKTGPRERMMNGSKHETAIDRMTGLLATGRVKDMRLRRLGFAPGAGADMLPLPLTTFLLRSWRRNAKWRMDSPIGTAWHLSGGKNGTRTSQQSCIH